QAHLETLTNGQFDALDLDGDGAVSEDELLAVTGAPAGCHANSPFGRSLYKLLSDALLIGLASGSHLLRQRL
ncbi:MAG: hypothetical protein HYZ00_11650, partial [Candidatus Hydrogenedentes bacterium]|nr:hypothetical protein [Candidatus Hydrogenedentota bacterium]